MTKVIVSLCVLTLFCSFATTASQTQTSSSANNDPIYQQLRNIGLGEAITVKDLDFKRDAATFHLRSGTVCFVTPVQNKVTGAVFVGDGNMGLNPPIPIEDRMLKLLTKEDEFSENFNQLVMRFTDATYDELRKAGNTGGSCDAGILKETQNALRHDRILRYNLDGRILQDVLSTEPGGLFVAFINGKRFNDKEVFAIDPHGAPPFVLPVAPEEVELVTYDESKLGVLGRFPSLK